MKMNNAALDISCPVGNDHHAYNGQIHTHEKRKKMNNPDKAKLDSVETFLSKYTILQLIKRYFGRTVQLM